MADGQGSNGSSNGNGNGYAYTARWQLIVSAAAVMIAIGGALLSLLLNINTLSNTTSNLTTRVAALEATATEIQSRRAAIQTEIAAIQRDLVEVETQFCAEDAMRNLMHANDLRDLGVLWAKAVGGELPIGNAYYPRVGRCNPNSQ